MKKESFDKLILRIKNDRKLLFIFLLGVFGIILIVLSSSGNQDNTDTNNTVEITSFNESEYIAELEKKLSEMISLISGAGNAKVIITLECDYETVYAKDGSLSKDDNSTDEDSEYIIIDREKNQSGLLLKTVTPKVRGIAVVCEGGDNQYVRNAVTEMLTAVLDVGVNRISVSKLNS
jgi:stage III sporulation protein AG